MTYSEAYDKLFSLFKSGQYQDWELTDPDTLQACKKILDSRGICVGYRFIELQEMPFEQNALFFEEEYLIADYSEEELWQCGRYYYTDRQDFDAIPQSQKFECLFETESSGEEHLAKDAYVQYWLALNR